MMYTYTLFDIIIYLRYILRRPYIVQSGSIVGCFWLNLYLFAQSIDFGNMVVQQIYL